MMKQWSRKQGEESLSKAAIASIARTLFQIARMLFEIARTLFLIDRTLFEGIARTLFEIAQTLARAAAAPAALALKLTGTMQGPWYPQSKVIFGRFRQLLAMNAHKMAPSTGQWLQVRVWDAPTKGLLWCRKRIGRRFSTRSARRRMTMR